MVATLDQNSCCDRAYFELIADQSAAGVRAEGQLASKELRYEQMEEEILLLRELVSFDKVGFKGKRYHVNCPNIQPRASPKLASRLRVGAQILWAVPAACDRS